MVHEISLVDAADLIHRGELRPDDLVEGCLERIARHEASLRAWVAVDEAGARRQAERLTAEAAQGTFRGRLHGIPLGIKDIIDVAGMPTEAGSPLRKGHRADRDAPVVAALRRAGAILLGKTVTVEFACFDPSPTRNPWDPRLRHSPGGSSSGSAAAVAAGMCFGALGSQTGGSLVRPASYCGIATCKPTYGRVDRSGVVPVSHHLDHVGPMARKVEDLAVLLDCLPRGSDFGPPPRRVGDSVPFDEHPPRLGLVEQFFMTEADIGVRGCVARAIERLARDTVVETAVPTVDFEAIQEVHTSVMAVEAAVYHRQDFAEHREAYGPMIAGLLERGHTTPGLEFAESLARLYEFRRRAPDMLGEFDALIMPATDTTAPATLETTGSKRFQAPWSCSGLPVVSLPCALADDGMPVAVQLVGRYHGDERLLEAARWCESRLAFEERPPLD